MKHALAIVGLVLFGGWVAYDQRKRDAMNEDECRRDLACYSERQYSGAQQACRAAVQKIADVKWDNEFYDPFFARTTWADETRGTLLLAGSFTKPRYQCLFDPASGSATIKAERLSPQPQWVRGRNAQVVTGAGRPGIARYSLPLPAAPSSHLRRSPPGHPRSSPNSS